jgi:hypothetical protein
MVLGACTDSTKRFAKSLAEAKWNIPQLPPPPPASPEQPTETKGDELEKNLKSKGKMRIPKEKNGW